MRRIQANEVHAGTHSLSTLIPAVPEHDVASRRRPRVIFQLGNTTPSGIVHADLHRPILRSHEGNPSGPW